MIKAHILEHRKGRENNNAKLWVNTIDFLSPIEFSKLYLMIETKIITLPIVALRKFTKFNPK